MAKTGGIMGKANGRKAIFITGAASGMGRETAKLFAGHGWFIGAYDVNASGLQALEQEIGTQNCVIRKLDVTDRKDYAAALAEFTAQTDGKLDIFTTMPASDAAALSRPSRSTM